MANLDLTQFKDFFINDVEEKIQNLNEGLLKIENNTAEENSLDEMMRFAHSIKGASATMGYNHLVTLTHIMEDVFDYARHGKLQLDESLISQLFTALDKIKQSVEQIKKNNTEIDFSDFSEELKKNTGVATESPTEKKNNERQKVERPKVEPPKLEPKNPDTIKKETSPTVTFTTKSEGLDFIKVKVTKLDNLMNLTEELLLEKLNLEELQGLMKENDDIKKNFKNIVEKMDGLIKETQYNVMESRLVAINQVFMQYPRLVRDLSKLQDKTIKLNIEGGEIELDRSIIDQLSEPLNHLLRNAVDHGIEKNGTITIGATREKDFAIISVIDDGMGIDLKKMIKKGVESKVILASEESKYTNMVPSEHPSIIPAIFDDLLFNPQISTSDHVTEVSGRGVGLNAVKNFVDSVGGSISVSMLPKGTAFQLKIPLSLVMISVLLVESAQHKYAIPLTSIFSSITLEPHQIRKVLTYDVGIHNGMEFPIIKLDQLFGLSIAEDNKAVRKVVLVKNESQVLGLAVDDLIREQEVVVKPLSVILKENDFFSGVSIIGSGKTVPIIDVHGLNRHLINNISTQA